jgi:hypothetical protein
LSLEPGNHLLERPCHGKSQESREARIFPEGIIRPEKTGRREAKAIPETNAQEAKR